MYHAASCGKHEERRHAESQARTSSRPMARFSRTIASTSEAMQELVADGLNFLSHFGIRENGGEKDSYYFRLALDEALENARTHGNRSNPDKMIFLTIDVTADKIAITIRDEGEGFDPQHLPDPRDDDNRYRLHGRGICLLKNLFTVTWMDGGRCIRIER